MTSRLLAGARMMMMMMMMMMDQSAYMLALFTGPGEAGSARRKMSPAAVAHLRQSDRRRSRPYRLCAHIRAAAGYHYCNAGRPTVVRPARFGRRESLTVS